MINDRTLRVLVLSDLHAHTQPASADGATTLSFHGDAAGVERMFEGVPAALAAATISEIDLVICAGDLADRCDSTALHQVWQRLCKLADDLDAPLIATAGNHDHNSRGETGQDPKTFLKALQPHFPMREEETHLRYFAHDYARTSVAGHTVVTLNSAALGGLQGPEGDEYKHGRVQDDQVRRLSKDLRTNRSKGARVLTVHHHPVQLPSIDLAERSQIRGAELLLEALADDGPWLIIHGHKHRPWIQYAPGGGGSAVLFSAGSFAAKLDGVLAQSTKNQFYVIDVLADDLSDGYGLGTAGTFRAWSYSPLGSTAWVPSGRTDGLPAAGGFGWRADPMSVARRIIAETRLRATDITADDLILWEPRIAYLAPDDLQKVEHHIEQLSSEVQLIFETNGQLARAAYVGT